MGRQSTEHLLARGVQPFDSWLRHSLRANPVDRGVFDDDV
jgi:hypothetical protein